MSNILEYVVSGTSYMRLSNPAICRDETNTEIVNMLIDKLVQDQFSHKFSMLYNGHTESSFGERFKPYKPYQVHADSGGLQMVTLGLDITDELKDKVYENQAQYADVGMCFDEIPVKVADGRSERNDTKGRSFDRENFESYARKTGQNIKRQLEIFDKFESSCKPFVILQGNDIDTYLQWYDYIMEEVPNEWHNRLGGVALGAAALGTGTLEDIKRGFIASEVKKRWPQDEMHLHVLGIGSIRRMLPYLVCLQNGLYKDINISYDSTTHSRAVETGLFYKGQGTIKYSREMSNYYYEMHKNCMETINLGVELDEFYQLLNLPSLQAKDKYGDLHKWLYVRTAFILMSVRNFMQHLEQMMLHEKDLLKFAGRMKLKEVFATLYQVKDRSDFEAWLNATRNVQALKSQSIGTGDEGSLDIEMTQTDQDALKQFKKKNFKKDTLELF